MRVRKWRQAGHIFAIGLSTLMPRPFSAYNVKTRIFFLPFWLYFYSPPPVISSTPFIPVSTRLPSCDHSILRPVASCVYISRSCHALHILFPLLTRICQLILSYPLPRCVWRCAFSYIPSSLSGTIPCHFWMFLYPDHPANEVCALSGSVYVDAVPGTISSAVHWILHETALNFLRITLTFEH
jgi:hypothetical protein